MSIKNRLDTLNINISNAPKAVGAYLAYKKIGNLVYISGQLPFKSDGTLIKGKVGLDINLKDSQEAAYFCTINTLAQLNLACDNNLDKVKNCIKITGFVNSTDDFIDQPKVINPASELLVKIFDDLGKHTRAAVSVNSLPLGAAVEIVSIFEIN